mmetsp:Transcript_90384/g.176927  ORF Transcript_90384/g.176927 Transcript_90384/m.176927 type:complete len:140 (-) Transcript_90384:118-537(-)
MSYYALASDVVHRIETSAEAAVAAGTADVAANADVEAAAAVAAAADDDESADQDSVEGTTADCDVAAVAICSYTYFAAASECEDLHTAYDLHTHCADLGRNFHVSAAVAYAVMVGCVSSRETACKLEQVVEVSIDHRTP